MDQSDPSWYWDVGRLIVEMPWGKLDGGRLGRANREHRGEVKALLQE